MRNRKKIIKDIKNKKLMYFAELDRLRLKVLLKNRFLNLEFKGYLIFLFNKKFRLLNFNRIVNRCVISGISKFTYKLFSLNRVFLKKNFMLGYINGLKKSSY